MSKISADGIRGENKLSFLRILIVVLVVIVVLLVCLVSVEVPWERATLVACKYRMKSLTTAFKVYADEFDGSLPSVESWCDALGKYMIPGRLICPGSNAREDQSSYAMNEFVDGKKLAELSPDLVLLFESMPGWNKAGGPEILTTEHHEDEGCNILFADGRVEFIKADRISELKWIASKNSSDE
jgi:prepilin-type processing-associated H-X9-DG protein